MLQLAPLRFGVLVLLFIFGLPGTSRIRAADDANATPPANASPAIQFVADVVEDPQQDLRLDWVNRVRVEGDFLFAVAHRNGRVNVFHRDPRSGQLEFRGFHDVAAQLKRGGTHLDAYPVLSAKNILYVTGAWTHAHGNADSLGLNWYQFDPKTGGLKLSGTIPCDAGELQSSTHPNLLYLIAPFSQAVYPIALDKASGAPTIGPKLSGAGIGGIGALAPDGKQFYSADDRALGWGQVDPDGGLSYGGACSLAALDPPKEPRSRSLTVSPDGKHAYLSLWTYKYNALGLFQRNVRTGALEFVKKIEVDPNMVGINHVVFNAAGTVGYYSSGPENSGACLGWFTRDPASGDLKFGGVAEKSKIGPNHFALAPESGTIYLAGNWNTRLFKIYRVKQAAGLK